eukprot:GEMP01101178.1.p1 GENE.GEMP01101178.1~~GEMP01101178.1.p1  ORF type:complete len:109 (+),score=4.36 GEMP01101178.1:291-617(+)
MRWFFLVHVFLLYNDYIFYSTNCMPRIFLCTEFVWVPIARFFLFFVNTHTLTQMECISKISYLFFVHTHTHGARDKTSEKHSTSHSDMTKKRKCFVCFSKRDFFYEII